MQNNFFSKVILTPFKLYPNKMTKNQFEITTITSQGHNTSPLDQFAIRNLISLDLPIFGDANLSLTNIGLYLTISTFIIIGLYLISTNYNKVVSNNWSASQESIYATVHSIVINQINEKKGQMYFPFIFTLFIFILTNNLIGMVKRCLYFIRYIMGYTQETFQYFTTNYIVNYFLYNDKNLFCSTLLRLYCNSTKFNKNYYDNKLNPYYITGFTDGEGCFSVSIFRDNRMLTGWQVKAVYKISLHNKDRPLLVLFQKFLGVGKIYKHGENSVEFRVSALKNLKAVINHLDKYPLITKKLADYVLFKQAVKLIADKEDLTWEGLLKLVNIKATLNTGLSDMSKQSFPNAVAVVKPRVKDAVIKDINWLIGFVEAEGSFQVIIQECEGKSVSVSLRFTLTQHSCDEQLMESLIHYLSCGRKYKWINRNEVYFIVSTFSDNYSKIIPLFAKYSLYGTKQQDYMDFVKVAHFIQNKDHLTTQGLKSIKLIHSKMNNRRSYATDPSK